MGYFLIVILVILASFSLFGIYIAVGIGNNKLRTDYSIDNYSFGNHDPEFNEEVKKWIKSIPRNYVKIKSPYFYKINALEINNNTNDKWIILLHGVTTNHKSMLDLAYILSEMEYNILIWDSRHHGESGGKNISYGYYEKNDLKAVIDYLRNKNNDEIKIGLVGESMGASILLSYASGIRDDCSFYIADCPYSNMKQQVWNVIKKTLKAPSFLMPVIMAFAQFFIRVIYKFDLNKIDILSKIHRVDNPVLFINCRDDDYIDPEMTSQLYEKCGSQIKEVCWFETGGHGGAFPANREGYVKAIREFLFKIGF